MRSTVSALLAIATLVTTACTATDSTSGPIATPVPTSAATPALLDPPPEPTATPVPVATTDPTPAMSADPARPTIDDLFESQFAINIAHAGGDLIGPHSTLFAMAQAVEAGAVVLELDVQLTADGALVVQHDATVDKTTEATGPVADLTLEELQALDNAYWFSAQCWPCQDRPVDEYIYRGVRTGDVEPPAGFGPDDFRVPTFREVVDRFPDVAFDIEIKGEGFAAFPAAQQLAREIIDLGIEANTIVVSFDDGVIAAFEIFAPNVETSPGLDALTAWVLLGEPLDDDHRIVQVPPAFEGVPVLTDAFWTLAAEAGVDVWVWMNDPSTQDNVAFYQELVAAGAAGIIAGRPNEMAAASL